MKRLNVRWVCVAGGAEAVRNWRERLNGIGVFSMSVSDCSNASSANPTISLRKDSKFQHPSNEEDVIANRSIFHSPMIVVALTASSLPSDRQEALTAGCNDLLAKVWFAASSLLL